MNDEKALKRALLFAPLCAPVMYCLITVIILLFSPEQLSTMPITAIGIFFVAAPMSYLCTAVIGEPYYTYLKAKQRLSNVTLTLGGVVFGAVIFVLFFSAIVEVPPMDELVQMIGMGAILGGSVAWTFGAIAGVPKARRPPP